MSAADASRVRASVIGKVADHFRIERLRKPWLVVRARAPASLAANPVAGIRILLFTAATPTFAAAPIAQCDHERR